MAAANWLRRKAIDSPGSGCVAAGSRTTPPAALAGRSTVAAAPLRVLAMSPVGPGQGTNPAGTPGESLFLRKLKIITSFIVSIITRSRCVVSIQSYMDSACRHMKRMGYPALPCPALPCPALPIHNVHASVIMVLGEASLLDIEDPGEQFHTLLLDQVRSPPHLLPPPRPHFSLPASGAA